MKKIPVPRAAALDDENLNNEDDYEDYFEN